ncbi:MULTISPECIES: cyclase family protein [Lachnospiraceae]|jgi:kynurenine formamidase|uniref:Cyclase family protein n=1 Tax=Faecalicatena acetigenes TaxID=2981790 RepID=A0ABT2TD73_9FIRM|nr:MULTISPECIES: cyclase family protein [Lachnospiraceae]MCU6748205.1 cyclase family protein [Faecalicatena acetigenes]RGT73072.1 cyclase family protein [Ruminococcus sp. AF18-22]SCI31720.1 Kynurenine formamidase [uncultured Clostridium sp.]
MNEQIIPLMQQVMDSADVIDLSYTMEPGMPVWPTHARFGAIIYETYDEGAVSLHRQINFGEHTGTHLDAPKHFIKGGASIEEVDVRTVIGRGVKIDASFLEPCGVYTLDMLKKFEEENGEIKQGDVILLHFGWEEKYGTGKDAEEFLKDWPGLGGDAAQYLLDKKVASVGTDALALDPFGSETYPCHYILLGSGVPIIENLTNLRKLPVFSYVIGLANKIKDGSASPIRVIALT